MAASSATTSEHHAEYMKVASSNMHNICHPTDSTPDEYGHIWNDEKQVRASLQHAQSDLFALTKLDDNLIQSLKQQFASSVENYADFISADMLCCEMALQPCSRRRRNIVPKSLVPLRYTENVCIAGGFALSKIIDITYHDIDMFIVNTDKPDFILEELWRYWSKHYYIGYIYYTQHAITFTLYNSKVLGITKVQLILHNYKSISHVLHSFDIDCCCFCWYDGNYYGTKRGIYAIKNRCNTVNVELASTSYTRRLIKYAQRGFRIKVPNYRPVIEDYAMLLQVSNRLQKEEVSYHITNLASLIIANYSQNRELLQKCGLHNSGYQFNRYLYMKKAPIAACSMGFYNSNHELIGIGMVYPYDCDNLAKLFNLASCIDKLVTQLPVQLTFDDGESFKTNNSFYPLPLSWEEFAKNSFHMPTPIQLPITSTAKSSVCPTCLNYNMRADGKLVISLPSNYVLSHVDTYINQIINKSGQKINIPSIKITAEHAKMAKSNDFVQFTVSVYALISNILQ